MMTACVYKPTDASRPPHPLITLHSSAPGDNVRKKLNDILATDVMVDPINQN